MGEIMKRSKLWKRIYNEIEKVKVIDSHAHTTSWEPYEVDLFTQMNYFKREIHNIAGKDWLELIKDAKRDKEKWSLLKPILEKTRNVSYWRHHIVTYKQVYGLKGDELNESNWDRLNKRIKSHPPGEKWHRKVLKEMCNIDRSIHTTDPTWKWLNPEYNIPVINLDRLVQINGVDNWETLENLFQKSFTNLKVFCQGIGEFIESVKAKGAVGIKFTHAYWRTLKHEKSSEHKVASIFQRMHRKEKLSLDELKIYQDYIVYIVAELAGELDLVVQIHTGMPGVNPIPKANPLLLENLCRDNPRTRFDIFHAGFPYSREFGLMAKHHPNVWANMCWMYVISISASRQILDEWFDLIPSHRILAFGSDLIYPEQVYGHLYMAKHCIADVLEKKVIYDFLSEEEALALPIKILRNNLIDLFKLDERYGIKKQKG